MEKVHRVDSLKSKPERWTWVQVLVWGRERFQEAVEGDREEEIHGINNPVCTCALSLGKAWIRGSKHRRHLELCFSGLAVACIVIMCTCGSQLGRGLLWLMVLEVLA